VSALLENLQEAAWSHANLYGAGWDDLHKNNTLWVLSRFHIAIERLPNWQEKVTLETWSKKPDGITAYRDFEMTDEQGSVIVKAASVWHIIDAQTFRIQKIETVMNAFPHCENRHVFYENPLKIAAFDCEEDIAIHHVKYSDIDMNNHVNNTKYVQWIFDDLDINVITSYSIKDLQINYIAQLQLGNSYTIHHKQLNETEFVHCVKNAENGKDVFRLQTVWV
jgi:acyl-ACP thioesterase